MYGCRVIQKALESISPDQQQLIIQVSPITINHHPILIPIITGASRHRPQVRQRSERQPRGAEVHRDGGAQSPAVHH